MVSLTPSQLLRLQLEIPQTPGLNPARDVLTHQLDRCREQRWNQGLFIWERWNGKGGKAGGRLPRIKLRGLGEV